MLFKVTDHGPTFRFDGFHRKEDWSGTLFAVFFEDGEGGGEGSA